MRDSGTLCVSYAIELPGVGDSFQGVNAPVLKRDTGADYQVLYGCRHEHLTRFCKAADASADVDSDSGQIVPADFAFAAMHAAADLDAKPMRLFRDGASAAHGSPGSVEGGEKAVTEGLYLATPEPRNLTASGPVV